MKNIKTLLHQYIIDAINGDEYDVNLDNASGDDKIIFLLKTYADEYIHPNAMRAIPNGTKRLASYFQGLPSCFDIEYRDYYISEIGVNWGIIRNDADRDAFVANWFNMIAAHIVDYAFSKVEFSNYWGILI